MIVASLFTTPEVLWSALVAGMGGVGAAGAKVLNHGHRISELEEEHEELKTDVKEDLKYLRDRIDQMHTHMLVTATNAPTAPGAPTNE